VVHQDQLRSQSQRDVAQDLTADRAEVLLGRLLFFRGALERGWGEKRRQLDVVAALGKRKWLATGDLVAM
jgi:hypothetical protein